MLKNSFSSRYHVSPIILLGGLILAIYAFVAIRITHDMQQAGQEQELKEVWGNFHAHNKYLNEVFEASKTKAQTIGQVTTSMYADGHLSASDIHRLLRVSTEQDRDYLGHWMVLDPAVVQGSGALSYEDLAADDAGYLVPYWYWQEDSVVMGSYAGYGELSYFQRPMKNHKPFLMERYLNSVEGNDSLLIGMSVPMFHQSKLIGVCGVDIKLEILRELVSELAYAVKGEVALISGDRQMICHSSSIDSMLDNSFGFQLAENKDFTKMDTVYYSGEQVILVGTLARSFSESDWRLFLRIPMDNLNDKYLPIRFNLVLISGLSALLVLSLLMYGSWQKRLLSKEKTKIEAELQRSDARLASHIESQMPSSIYSVDNNYKYTGFNSTHKREMKETFEADVAVGSYMPDLLPDDLATRLIENFKKTLKGEQFSVTSFFNDRYYTQVFNPVFDQESSIIGLTSAIYEVTEKVKAEQEVEKYKDHLEELVEERTKELKSTVEELNKTLERLQNAQLRLIESEKMASIGSLTAGLAHEINNPINYVSGNITPIKSIIKEIRKIAEENGWLNKTPVIDELMSEVNGLLDGVQEGAKRVSDLIMDLRAFSGQGRYPKESGIVNINQCITSTINLVRHQQGKKIDFELALAEVPLIKSNEQQLKQVFLNLLNNACQSIEKEGTIKVHSSLDDEWLDEWLIIKITDTGTGISEDIRNRVFEPFFTTKEVGEGTGLGLSVVYSILRDMKGEVSIPETSPAGTTVEIRIPIEAVD